MYNAMEFARINLTRRYNKLKEGGDNGEKGVDVGGQSGMAQPPQNDTHMEEWGPEDTFQDHIVAVSSQ